MTWLAPVPFRGKKNQPAYVRQVADYVAELLGLDVADLTRQTNANFDQLFGLNAS